MEKLKIDDVLNETEMILQNLITMRKKKDDGEPSSIAALTDLSDKLDHIGETYNSQIQL